MEFPEILKPSLNGTKGIISLAIVFLLGGGGIVYAIVQHKKNEKREATTGVIETQGGIDPAFFAATQFAEPKKEEQPSTQPREIPPPPPAPAVAPAIPAPPPPPPALSAPQIFSTVHPLPKPQDDPAVAINAARRGHTVIEIPEPVRPQAKIDWAIKDKAWREANSDSKWAEERTEASLPVDMSRVVHAGKFIPAVLVNEINSELPGKVVAVIEENVYGSHERKVLIPAGSTAIGRYKPLAKAGDRRIAVIWERLITYPDGINIPLRDAEMSDAMGRSGITGEVDNRFAEKYGMALFVSTLGAIAQTQIPVDNRAAGLAVESIGNTSAGMAKMILEKQLDLKPVVTIPQGSPIMISPQRDVWFKPSKDGKTRAVESVKR